MNDLVPCPGCSRHIRRREGSCPFCGANVAEAIERSPVLQVPTARLSRAALFTFAAATIGAAACSGDDGSEPGPGGGGAGASTAGTGGSAGQSGATAMGGAQNGTGGRNMGGMVPN